MTTEIFDWGLDSIRKKYEEEDARLRAKIASIDWEAARLRAKQAKRMKMMMRLGCKNWPTVSSQVR